MNEQLLDKAKKYMLNDDEESLKAALSILELLTNTSPNEKEYLYNYAECLAKTNDKEKILKAINIYKDLCKTYNVDYTMKIAKLYTKIGKPEKAIKRYERIKHNNVYAKLELAKLYYYQNQFKKSLLLLEEIEGKYKKKKDVDSTMMINTLSLEKKIYFKKMQINLFNNKICAYYETELNDYLFSEYIKEQYAENCYCSKKFEEAEKLYLELNECQSNYLKNYHLAEINFHRKNYEEAIYYFEESIKYTLEEKTGFVHYKLGNCYYELKNYEQAKKSYEKANKISPTSQCVLKLGKLEVLMHDLDETNESNYLHLHSAANVFKRGVELFPCDLFIKYELARVEHKLGKHNSALKYLNEILEVKKDRLSLIEKAKILQDERKYLSAIEIYNDLLKTTPEDIKLITELGVCYLQLDNYEEALIKFDRVLDLTNGTDLCAKSEKAVVLRKMGRVEESEALFRETKDNIGYYEVEMARNSFENGNLEEADNIITDFINKNPNHSKALYIKAVVEKEKGNYEEAIEYIRRTNNLVKKNSQNYLLAQCYELMGELDLAIKEYSKLLNSVDFAFHSYLAISKIYYSIGDYENAYNYAYPVTETRKYADAYAIMIKIEELFGHNDVIERYYDSFSENTREYVKSLVDKK